MMNCMMMVQINEQTKITYKITEEINQQDYLYTDEKLREMKQTLRLAEEEMAEIEAKSSKGFK